MDADQSAGREAEPAVRPRLRLARGPLPSPLWRLQGEKAPQRHVHLGHLLHDLGTKVPAPRPPPRQIRAPNHLVAQTRAYMTFGWSPHGVLCDLHALDTRDPLLKTVSVSGGPYSSKLCQVSVEFAKEKEKSAPISIQWHRSKNGKPFAPIEGGEMPKQAPNQRVPIMDPSLTLLRALLTLLSLPPPPPLPLPLSLSLCVFSCVLV